MYVALAFTDEDRTGVVCTAEWNNPLRLSSHDEHGPGNAASDVYTANSVGTISFNRISLCPYLYRISVPLLLLSTSRLRRNGMVVFQIESNVRYRRTVFGVLFTRYYRAESIPCFTYDR